MMQLAQNIIVCTEVSNDSYEKRHTQVCVNATLIIY